ncbi:MAG TPA: hypothetical protein VGR45_11895 [Stellaceae bacterium]|nr:hypothetical protein [Stellaceae bacterium]
MSSASDAELPANAHRFFLVALDPDHGCPVLEAMFSVARLEDLRELLGPCAADDPELEGSYSVDRSDLAALAARFGVEFDPADRLTFLEGWHPLRAAPYLIHTGYELFLLLDGTKKLARFNEPYPPLRHDNEDRFDRYVLEGLLYKEVFTDPWPRPRQLKSGWVVEGLREVYYTPKGEEWRIPASRLLWAAAVKCRWNEGFERLEGMLFGYQDWQIDWWIAHARERGARWAEPLASSDPKQAPG